MARTTEVPGRRRSSAALVVALLAAMVGALFLAIPQAAPAHADAAGQGGNYVPLATNVRVLDTRNSVGVATTTTLGAGASTTAFAVTGVGGIPSSGVTGVLATVAVIGATANTYVSVYPDDGTQTAASTVHVLSGNPNFSNTVATPLSSAGKLRAYNSVGTAHVVIDVQGYFTSSNTTGGGFVPITQARTTDSRSNLGTTGGAIAPGGTRTVTLPTSAVPTDASAVYINLLVPTATKAGGMNVSGTGTGGSTFNYAGGSSSSGMSVKPSAGKIVLRNTTSSEAANFVIDVQGYWTSSPTTGAGYRATPNQGNLIYTIPFDDQMPAGATYKFRAAGAYSLPTQGVAGVLLNIHVRNQTTSSTNFKAWPTGTAEPATSVNNNPGDGETRDNLNIVKPGADGTISIKNNGAVEADVYVQIEGWFADPLPALAIEQNPRIVGLQRSGAAGTVRPIDFAFTTNTGWLETGRIPNPATLSIDETTYQLLSGGDTFTQTPSLAEGYDNKLTIAGHNTDSNVWLKTETSPGTSAWPTLWTKQGGSPTGPPTITKLSDNRLAMLAVDTNGALWASIQTTTTGGPWDPWRYLGTPGLTGPVTVIPTTTGGATLFARTTTGNLTTTTLTITASTGATGGWNDKPAATTGTWTDLGNPGTPLDATAGPAVAVNGTQQRLVVRKTDSTIWTRQGSGTTWSTWTQIPGITNAVGRPTALLHPTNNTWQVLVRNADAKLAWVSEISTGSNTWTTWKINPYAGVVSDPNSITWTNADNSKGWGVFFSDSAGHNVIGNFSTAIPPAPAGAKASPKAAETSKKGEPHFVILKQKK